MAIVQIYSETRIRENFSNKPVHFKQVFFWHGAIQSHVVPIANRAGHYSGLPKHLGQSDGRNK